MLYSRGALVALTRALCIPRLLTLDALVDPRPEPRRVVYAFGIVAAVGAACVSPQSVPWVLVGCVIVSEALFRLLILVLALALGYGT
jgi:hypothetical protein